MYTKKYPALSQKYPDGFELLAETMELHFPYLFNLEILEQELFKNNLTLHYFQFFNAIVQELACIINPTKSEIIRQTHHYLAYEPEIRKYFLTELVFVPPLKERATTQLAFHEKMISSTLQYLEPVTFLDMLRAVTYIREFANRSRQGKNAIGIMNLCEMEQLQWKLGKYEYLILNINDNLAGPAKWGFFDLKTSTFYCEANLFVSQKERLLKLNLPNLKIEFQRTQTEAITGYEVLARLNDTLGTGWPNHGIHADFHSQFADYIHMMFGGYINADKKIYLMDQTTISYTFIKSERKYCSANFLRASNTWDYQSRFTKFAATPHRLGLIEKMSNSTETYLSSRSHIPVLIKTLQFLSMIKVDHQGVSLFIESDLTKAADPFKSVYIEKAFEPLGAEAETYYRMLSRVPDTSPSKEEIVASSLLNFIRAYTKLRELSIHLAPEYGLNSEEQVFIRQLIQNNAYLLVCTINEENLSLSQFKEAIRPILGRNQWLKDKGYLPSQLDNYWKKAATYWLIHLQEYPSILTDTAFKDSVKVMGSQGLYQVFALLEHDSLMIRRIYGPCKPIFYADCMENEIASYLSAITGYLLQPGTYFPFSELCLPYYPKMEDQYLSLLQALNARGDVNNLRLIPIEGTETALSELVQILKTSVMDEPWTVKVIIPGYENNLALQTLNNQIIKNVHQKVANLALSRVTTIASRPNSKPIERGQTWSLKRAGAVQLQQELQQNLEQQKTLQLTNQLQQQQSQVLEEEPEGLVLGELVTHENIDEILGNYFLQYQKDNRIYPKAAPLGSVTESFLQRLFHTWINANPNIETPQLIHSMTIYAAKTLLHWHHRFASGINHETLKGFDTIYDEAGHLVLIYDPKKDAKTPNTALSLQIPVPIPKAEPWQGNYLIFGHPTTSYQDLFALLQPEAILSDPQISEIEQGLALLLNLQDLDCLDWAKTLFNNLSQLQALGQVYYSHGSKGLFQLLTTLRAISSQLGNKFLQIFLKPCDNYSCLIQDDFFKNMQTMLDQLAGKPHQRQVFITLCKKHFSAVAWEQPETLWKAFAYFYQQLKEEGLYLKADALDGIAPGNMLTLMERLLMNLETLPTQFAKQNFMNCLSKLDLTRGGMFSATVEERLTRFEEGSALRLLDSKDKPPHFDLFGTNAARLWQWMCSHLLVPTNCDAKVSLSPFMRYLKNLQNKDSYLNELEPLIVLLEKTAPEHFWSVSFLTALLTTFQTDNKENAFPILLFAAMLEHPLLSAKPHNTIQMFPSVNLKVISELPSIQDFTACEQVSLLRYVLNAFPFNQQNIALLASLPSKTRSYALEQLDACKQAQEFTLELTFISQLVDKVKEEAYQNVWLKKGSRALFFEILRDKRAACLLKIVAGSCLAAGFLKMEAQQHLLDKLQSWDKAMLAQLASHYPQKPNPNFAILQQCLDKIKDMETLKTTMTEFELNPYPTAVADYKSVKVLREIDLRRMFKEALIDSAEGSRSLHVKELGEISLIFAFIKRLESGVLKMAEEKTSLALMNQSAIRNAFQRSCQQRPLDKDPCLHHAEYLALLFKALHRTTGKYPHMAQQFALIVNVHCIDAKSRVLRLATGEGKSHLIAMIAAIQAAQGQRVDIATAKQSLARRDLKEYQPFFDYLGFNATYIHAKSQPQGYLQAHIVYTTLSDLSLFLDEQALLSGPINRTITIDKTKRIGLFDEFDFIYDQGQKTQYNYARPISRTPKEMLWFYKAVNLFYRKHLQAKNTIDGYVLQDFTAYLLKKAGDFGERQALVQELSREPLQLVRWLQSALEAASSELGKNFTVNRQTIMVGNIGYPLREIIPLELNTGEKLTGSTFSLGVQQLLAVRLNEEAEQKGQQADFHLPRESYLISSQSASHRMEELWHSWIGFTGSISKAQISTLNQQYGTQVFLAPTNQKTLRTWHKPILFNEESKRTEAMIEKIQRCLEQKKSALIACKNDKEVEQLRLLFSQTFKDNKAFLYYNNESLETPKKILKIKKEKENWVNNQQQQAVILVASCFGRGDNVHVHNVFLLDANDNNDREQKGGRCARNGEEGEVHSLFLVPLSDIKDQDPDAYLLDLLSQREKMFNRDNFAKQYFHKLRAEFSSWGLAKLADFEEPDEKSAWINAIQWAQLALEEEWICLASQPDFSLHAIQKKLQNTISDLARQFRFKNREFSLSAPPVYREDDLEPNAARNIEALAEIATKLVTMFSKMDECIDSTDLSQEILQQMQKLSPLRLEKLASYEAYYKTPLSFLTLLNIQLEKQELGFDIREEDSLETGLRCFLVQAWREKKSHLNGVEQNAAAMILSNLCGFSWEQQTKWGGEYIKHIHSLIALPQIQRKLLLTSLPMAYEPLMHVANLCKTYAGNHQKACFIRLHKMVAASPTFFLKQLAICEKWQLDPAFFHAILILKQKLNEDDFALLVQKTDAQWNGKPEALRDCWQELASTHFNFVLLRDYLFQENWDEYLSCCLKLPALSAQKGLVDVVLAKSFLLDIEDYPALNQAIEILPTPYKHKLLNLLSFYERQQHKLPSASWYFAFIAEHPKQQLRLEACIEKNTDISELIRLLEAKPFDKSRLLLLLCPKALWKEADRFLKVFQDYLPKEFYSIKNTDFQKTWLIRMIHAQDTLMVHKHKLESWLQTFASLTEKLAIDFAWRLLLCTVQYKIDYSARIQRLIHTIKNLEPLILLVENPKLQAVADKILETDLAHFLSLENISEKTIDLLSSFFHKPKLAYIEKQNKDLFSFDDRYELGLERRIWMRLLIRSAIFNDKEQALREILVAQSFQKYLDKAKQVLEAKPEASTELTRDLTATQQRVLFNLSKELSMIGNLKTAPLIQDNLYNKDMKKLVGNYEACWFKSSSRESQLQKLKSDLKTGKSYEQIMNIINIARTAAIRADHQENKSRYFYNLNVSGHSRYFSTLNQLQDMIARRWAEDSAAFMSFTQYQAKIKQEFVDLAQSMAEDFKDYPELQAELIAANLIGIQVELNSQMDLLPGHLTTLAKELTCRMEDMDSLDTDLQRDRIGIDSETMSL